MMITLNSSHHPHHESFPTSDRLHADRQLALDPFSGVNDAVHSRRRCLHQRANENSLTVAVTVAKQASTLFRRSRLDEDEALHYITRPGRAAGAGLPTQGGVVALVKNPSEDRALSG